MAGAPQLPGIPIAVKLAVIKESRPGEDRVAIVPEVAAKLAKSGVDVVVQSGAAAGARFSDEDFVNAGATVVPDAAAALKDAEFVAHVQPLTVDEVAMLPQGVSVMSFLQPVASSDVVQALAAKGATVYSLDLLPRISRAQSMDALSSQATVAGYRAGLSAAEHLAKFFPMFMTAAGTVPPAKVLVMGAGVAGLFLGRGGASVGGRWFAASAAARRAGRCTSCTARRHLLKRLRLPSKRATRNGAGLIAAAGGERRGRWCIAWLLYPGGGSRGRGGGGGSGSGGTQRHGGPLKNRGRQPRQRSGVSAAAPQRRWPASQSRRTGKR